MSDGLLEQYLAQVNAPAAAPQNCRSCRFYVEASGICRRRAPLADARLKAALVEHNDVLRSAFQIAKREGAETNWTGFANTIWNCLSAHHETSNKAREEK